MTPLSVIEAAKCCLKNLTFELSDVIFRRDRAQKEVEQAAERLRDYNSRIAQIICEKDALEKWLKQEDNQDDN